MEEAFFSPRFVGTRFQNHSIPLECLRDLAVLEEMVVEVAKWVFLKENSDRSRTPRGFTDGIELKLTHIEQGSAIPVISLCIASATLFPPGNVQYFEKARDSIISAIAAAGASETITDFFPDHALVYFDRFGRSLRDGESIELGYSQNTHSASLTKETRRRLILASTEVRELTEETTVRGSVPEVDQDKMTFQIQLITGKKITSPLETQHRENVIEAFNHYHAGQRILLQGVGKYDRNGKLQRIESIEHTNLLDLCDVPARLEELSLLKNGWLDGQGFAPKTNGLDWLSIQFGNFYPDDLSLPCLFPTPDGGVQAEWSLDSHEISLDIDLDRHSAIWHEWDADSDVDLTQELNLDDQQAWAFVADQIQNLSQDEK